MPEPLLLPDGSLLPLAPLPLVMGIVNVTPDSFSGDGLGADGEAAIAQGVEQAADGAAIVDVGGESTRPRHLPVDAETEMRRVLPVIAGLAARIAAPISIDTSKSAVAAAALKAGARIVNDVWGCQRDPAVAGVAAEHGAPLIVMHNRETIDAGLDIFDEVLRFLERSIAIATAARIPRSQLVVDPGIGFGKTPVQNLSLIAGLDRLSVLGCPILLGVSRKSIVGLVTGRASPRERLPGTLAAHLHGARRGAAILRVHDVPAHVDALKMLRALDDPRGTGL